MMKIINGKTVAIIPARAGSKRLPGKNTKMFNGKPLLFWTIEAALHADLVDIVLLTSESDLILSSSRQEFQTNPKFMTLKRPQYLALDEVQTDDVALHACLELSLSGGLPQTGILLQPTSPLRTSEDIDTAIMLHAKTGYDATVIGVYEDNMFGWHITDDERRLSRDISSMPRMIPDGHDPMRRTGKQWMEMDDRYVENGAVYVFNTRHFVIKRSYRMPPYIPFYMSRERSIDIDDELDFFLAEQTAKYYENRDK